MLLYDFFYSKMAMPHSYEHLYEMSFVCILMLIIPEKMISFLIIMFYSFRLNDTMNSVSGLLKIMMHFTILPLQSSSISFWNYHILIKAYTFSRRILQSVNIQLT